MAPPPGYHFALVPDGRVSANRFHQNNNNGGGRFGNGGYNNASGGGYNNAGGQNYGGGGGYNNASGGGYNNAGGYGSGQGGYGSGQGSYGGGGGDQGGGGGQGGGSYNNAQEVLGMQGPVVLESAEAIRTMNPKREMTQAEYVDALIKLFKYDVRLTNAEDKFKIAILLQSLLRKGVFRLTQATRNSSHLNFLATEVYNDFIPFNLEGYSQKVDKFVDKFWGEVGSHRKDVAIYYGSYKELEKVATEVALPFGRLIYQDQQKFLKDAILIPEIWNQLTAESQKYAIVGQFIPMIEQEGEVKFDTNWETRLGDALKTFETNFPRGKQMLEESFEQGIRKGYRGRKDMLNDAKNALVYGDKPRKPGESRSDYLARINKERAKINNQYSNNVAKVADQVSDKINMTVIIPAALAAFGAGAAQGGAVGTAAGPMGTIAGAAVGGLSALATAAAIKGTACGVTRLVTSSGTEGVDDALIISDKVSDLATFLYGDSQREQVMIRRAADPILGKGLSRMFARGAVFAKNNLVRQARNYAMNEIDIGALVYFLGKGANMVQSVVGTMYNTANAKYRKSTVEAYKREAQFRLRFIDHKNDFEKSEDEVEDDNYQARFYGLVRAYLEENKETMVLDEEGFLPIEFYEEFMDYLMKVYRNWAQATLVYKAALYEASMDNAKPESIKNLVDMVEKDINVINYENYMESVRDVKDALPILPYQRNQEYIELVKDDKLNLTEALNAYDKISSKPVVFTEDDRKKLMVQHIETMRSIKNFLQDILVTVMYQEIIRENVERFDTLRKLVDSNQEFFSIFAENDAVQFLVGFRTRSIRTFDGMFTFLTQFDANTLGSIMDEISNAVLAYNRYRVKGASSEYSPIIQQFLPAFGSAATGVIFDGDLKRFRKEFDIYQSNFKYDNLPKKGTPDYTILFQKYVNSNRLLIKDESIIDLEEKFDLQLYAGDLPLNMFEEFGQFIGMVAAFFERKNVYLNDLDKADTLERTEKALSRFLVPQSTLRINVDWNKFFDSVEGVSLDDANLEYALQFTMSNNVKTILDLVTLIDKGIFMQEEDKEYTQAVENVVIRQPPSQGWNKRLIATAFATILVGGYYYGQSGPILNEFGSNQFQPLNDSELKRFNEGTNNPPYATTLKLEAGLKFFQENSQDSEDRANAGIALDALIHGTQEKPREQKYSSGNPYYHESNFVLNPELGQAMKAEGLDPDNLTERKEWMQNNLGEYGWIDKSRVRYTEKEYNEALARFSLADNNGNRIFKQTGKLFDGPAVEQYQKLDDKGYIMFPWVSRSYPLIQQIDQILGYTGAGVVHGGQEALQGLGNLRSELYYLPRNVTEGVKNSFRNFKRFSEGEPARKTAKPPPKKEEPTILSRATAYQVTEDDIGNGLIFLFALGAATTAYLTYVTYGDTALELVGRIKREKPALVSVKTFDRLKDFLEKENYNRIVQDLQDVVNGKKKYVESRLLKGLFVDLMKDQQKQREPVETQKDLGDLMMAFFSTPVENTSTMIDELEKYVQDKHLESQPFNDFKYKLFISQVRAALANKPLIANNNDDINWYRDATLQLSYKFHAGDTNYYLKIFDELVRAKDPDVLENFIIFDHFVRRADANRENAGDSAEERRRKVATGEEVNFSGEEITTQGLAEAKALGTSNENDTKRNDFFSSKLAEMRQAITDSNVNDRAFQLLPRENVLKSVKALDEIQSIQKSANDSFVLSTRQGEVEAVSKEKLKLSYSKQLILFKFENSLVGQNADLEKKKEMAKKITSTFEKAIMPHFLARLKQLL